jgi:hypothetical protein
VSLPVLARLADDQLVNILHILVNLHLLSGKGAEQQLEAILGLKSGGQGDQRGVANLHISMG